MFHCGIARQPCSKYLGGGGRLHRPNRQGMRRAKRKLHEATQPLLPPTVCASVTAFARSARLPVVVSDPLEWPRERRQLPPRLAAEAAANPGGSVAEIDGSMVRDPDGYVPPEATIGIFAVGPDGQATGDYLRNPRYGPVRDDFAPLESADHLSSALPGAADELYFTLTGTSVRTPVSWAGCAHTDNAPTAYDRRPQVSSSAKSQARRSPGSRRMRRSSAARSAYAAPASPPR